MYQKFDIITDRATIPMILTPTDGTHVHIETGEGDDRTGSLRDIFNYTPARNRTPIHVSAHFHLWDDGTWHGIPQSEDTGASEARNVYLSRRDSANIPKEYELKLKVLDELRPLVEAWAAENAHTLHEAQRQNLMRELARASDKVTSAHEALNEAQERRASIEQALQALTHAAH